MEACINGHEDIVKSFLDYSQSIDIDLNAKDSEGHSALILAVNNGHLAVTKVLLEHPHDKQIDFNASGYDHGMTALMWACNHGIYDGYLGYLGYEGYYEDIVKMFLKQSDCNQIDLNAKNKYGCTAFMFACSKECRNEDNKYLITKLLLEHSGKVKIDVNARNHDGNTALLQVCQGENQKVIPFVQFLIQYEDIEIPAEKPHLLRQALTNRRPEK